MTLHALLSLIEVSFGWIEPEGENSIKNSDIKWLRRGASFYKKFAISLIFICWLHLHLNVCSPPKVVIHGILNWILIQIFGGLLWPFNLYD